MKSNKRRIKPSYPAASNDEDLIYDDPQKKLPPLSAKTPKQKEYLKALSQSNQVITFGCSGTGKTYLAARTAAKLLRDKLIQKIIICRPNVSASKSLGFYPGDKNDKILGWAVPITDTLKEDLGNSFFEYCLTHNKIEIVPFELIRGRSWKDCFVILDEGQNTTVEEMRMFLTRIGENTRVVVNGDIKQKDISKTSGLAHVLYLIKTLNMDVPVIEFGIDDIIRSGVCRAWVEAFEEFPGV